MNRVGEQGRGRERLAGLVPGATSTRLRAVCDAARRRGPRGRAAARRRARLGQAVDAQAWDGAWYRRAYFDDGTPLGSAANDECTIDSIAQSWAVIAGVGDPDARAQAMRSLERAPGADRRRPDPAAHAALRHGARTTPATSRATCPGVRENGGQYTHARSGPCWPRRCSATATAPPSCSACSTRSTTRARRSEVERYRVEPYVVAADVYARAAARRPRRLDLVHRLGRLDLPPGRRDNPGLAPAGRSLPGRPDDPERLAALRTDLPTRRRDLLDRRRNPDGVSRGVRRVELDGSRLPSADIPFTDDGGQHHVRVELGPVDDEQAPR